MEGSRSTDAEGDQIEEAWAKLVEGRPLCRPTHAALDNTETRSFLLFRALWQKIRAEWFVVHQNQMV